MEAIMSGDDLQRLRIEELERKLANAMRRIEALEARDVQPASPKSAEQLTALRQPIPKPPVITKPQPTMVAEAPQPARPLKVYATAGSRFPDPVEPANKVERKTPEPKAPKSAARLEYDLGAKVMPWAGSLIVIVAIGFLIGNGIERGWLTPWMQFSLAMLLSAAFIGVGFWKRATREDFGGILIGVGSCGVFLALAGGQVFHQLYTKEMLVGSFLAWGLTNLGYSSFVKSRAFLVIGFLGGLGAALMPMAERNVPVNVALHFAVVIPALAIALRHRWLELIFGSWFVSVGCLIPALFADADWLLRVGAFGFNGLITAIAYCRAFRENAFDPKGIFPAFMAGAAGIAALFLRYDMVGSAGVAGVAAAFGLAAYLNRTTKPSEPMAIGAALVGVLLLPLCFPGYVPSMLYAIFAIVCTAVSLKWSPRASVVLAGLAIAGSLLLYLSGASIAPALPWAVDIALLVLIAGSAAVFTWGANRVRKNEESWTFAACVIAIPLLSRMAWLGGSGPLTGVLGPPSTIVLTLLVSAMTLAHFAGRRWVSANALSWFTTASAAFVYMGTQKFALPVELTILATAAATALILCRSTTPLIKETSSPEAMPCIGSALLLAIASRASWILAEGPLSSAIDPVSALSLTWLAFAAGMTAILDRKLFASHVLACVAVGIAGLIHLSRENLLGLDYRLHMTILLSAVGTLWFVGRRSISLAKGDDAVQASIGVVGGLIASVSAGALYLTLLQPFGMPEAAATVMALAAASLGCSVHLAARRWVSSAILSGGFAAAGFIAYLWPILIQAEGVGSLSARISKPLGVYALPLAIVVLVAVTVAGILASRLPKVKPIAVFLAMAFNWPMFVQIGLLTTAGLYDPAHWNWVISGFWVLYGSIILALGFIRDERILRFGSFGIFGMTIIKIFTWDLGQSIDPVMRVVILLGLGLAMLGGGYTYIRTRAGKDEIVEAGT